MFGVLTLVMDVFKTGYYSSFSHCLTAIKITYPIVQAMFVIVQVSEDRIVSRHTRNNLSVNGSQQRVLAVPWLLRGIFLSHTRTNFIYLR